MHSLRFIALPALAALIASCAPKSNQDADPYGVADSGYGDPYGNPNAPYGADPIYDTPAAYEEAGSTHAPADHGATAANPTWSGGAAATPATRAATTHLVVTGDTLSKIASQYGVSMTDIKAANNMTNDTVVLGRTLKIPAGGTAGARATTTAAAPAGSRTHVVVQGDTLGKIAAKYGVSTAAIKQANRMTNDTVVLGRKLVIPAR